MSDLRQLKGPVTLSIPPGDDRQRLVCTDCGFVNYVNPKIVVGAVVTQGDKYVLCRRAIEPRRGFWTIPAGFLEEHEDPQTGACREAMEEATADIAIDALLAVYALQRISQVQLIYRAALHGSLAPGPESLAVELFDWAAVPWNELAFPSVYWSLNHHRQVRGTAVFAPFVNPPGRTGDLDELTSEPRGPRCRT